MAYAANKAQGEATFNTEAFKMELNELRMKELKGRKLTAETNVNIGNFLQRVDKAWKAAKTKPAKPELQKALGVGASEWSRLTKLASWVAEEEAKKALPAPNKDEAGDRAQKIMDYLYELRQGKAKAEDAKAETKGKAKGSSKAKSEKPGVSKDDAQRMAEVIADKVSRIVELQGDQWNQIVNAAMAVIAKG